MGKFTDALKKATEERLARIQKIDQGQEVKYEFVARKTVDSTIDPRVVPFFEADSPVTEQYRVLRTNIQALDIKPQVKVMTVTSALHNEGKTISSINMAITFAHDLSKKNILLVDADMRKSRISKYLGITPEIGLSDIVSNGRNVEEALLHVGIDNLTVLPAGKHPRNPAELLGSVKMRNLISYLKTKYDYIFFDAPPIISLTDAGVLGAQTDGVIMVIQANRTQKGVVHHAESLLKQSQSKILGYILTNIQYHIPQYLYRYL